MTKTRKNSKPVVTRQAKVNQATIKQNDMNASALVGRAAIARGLGKSFGGDRDLYEVLGYPKEPVYDDFKNVYERDGLATRIVDAVSDETWRETPLLIEGEQKKADELDDPGPLQIAFTELADRLDLWTAFNDADAACGISRFSLLVLGLPGNMEDECRPGGDLAYVTVHDEGSAQVDETSLVTDTSSPRFGLPDYYQVMIDERMKTQKRVHYSRVIHIKEGRSRSRIYGVPRLKSMLNRLMDLEKVIGSGSEAFFQLIHRGMVIAAKDGSVMPPADSPEFRQMQAEIDEYVHNLRRYMRLSNAEVTDMGGKPVDSDAQFRVIISYLAGASHIPQRILIGSEAGQLASSQDEYNFAGFIQSRQIKFAEPKILRAFIKKCGELGILNVPPKYTVDWPSLFQLTDAENAQIASTVAGAMSTASGGAPETIMPPDEFAKRYLDYVPEVPDPIEVLQPGDFADVASTATPSQVIPVPVNLPSIAAALQPSQTTQTEPLPYSMERVIQALTTNKATLPIWLNAEDGNSVMVAFQIPEVLRQTLQDAYPFMDDETRDNLHITLAYIGDARTLDMAELTLAVADFAEMWAPIKTQMQGLARFVSGTDKDPIVATFDSSDMPALHGALTMCLDNHGVPYHQEHGFLPHMTLAYIGKDEPMPIDTIEPLEINFSQVFLVWGSQWIKFDLDKVEPEMPVTEPDPEPDNLLDTESILNSYDSSQPRDPKGSETGGQWTKGDKMTTEKYNEIMADYKKKVVAIAKEAPKTNPPTNQQKYIDNAYAMGQKAKNMGLSSGREAIQHSEFETELMAFDKPEHVAFEAGIKGNQKPYWVNGWRYGKIPKGGSSTNYAEAILESGVSFMGTDNGMATGDVGFEMFTTNRDIYFGSGFLNTNRTGSDGEPLLLWAIETGKK
jgi:hypothetical protein